MNTTRLPAPPEPISFHITGSSPSQPGYPPSELETQTIRSKGWRTASIPGELILTLKERSDLALLQVLSHETRIASRIDVFVMEDEDFKLVGAIELDNNEKSGYCARELQSVHVAQSGVTHVKLVFQKPHENVHNPERAVSILGLNLLGWKAMAALPSKVKIGSAPPAKAVTAVESAGLSPSSIAATFLVKAEEMRKLKESAVAREAFESAIEYKSREMQLRHLAQLAGQLEEAKRRAIANEDYDEAKQIKEKITELFEQPHDAQQQPPHHHQDRAKSPQSFTTARPGSPVHLSTSLNVATPVHRSASPPVPTLAHGALGGGGGKINLDDVGSPIVAETSARSFSAAPDDFWPENDRFDALSIAEELPASAVASPEVKEMIENLGEYTVRCLYSADVRLRGAIFEKLDEYVRSEQGSDSKLEAALTAAKMGLADSAPHVFVGATKFMDAIIDQAQPNAIKSSPQINQVVGSLVEGLSNSSSIVHDAASSLLSRFVDVVGADVTLNAVTQSKSNKKSTLWRPLHARLMAAVRAVHSKDFDVSIWVVPLMDWMNKNDFFSHANEAVREGALLLTVEMYTRAGRSDRTYLNEFLTEALRPALLEKYRAHMDKAIPAEQLIKGKLVTPVMFREPKHETEKAGFMEESDDDDDLGTCRFCKYSNPRFLECEDAIDMHYWQNCPMLAKCARCDQVIEIARLNEHLLEECDMKSNHRSCPRCREAIAAQFFEKHVKRDACLIAKPKSVANRCPLCHTDIEPLEIGWTRHLLSEVCPKNQRTVQDDD